MLSGHFIRKVIVVRQVFEIIFRHPIRLLIFLILFPALSLAIVFTFAHSYQATASLWALRRYEIISATGVETNLLASPADTQVAVLTELLQTRSFDLAVAKDANLASTLDPAIQNDPQQKDDALFADLSKNVLPQSQGYNVILISYTNNNAQISQQVVAAIIKEYATQSHTFSITEGQHLLTSYQAQLPQAKQDADTAASAESQYLLLHPGINKLSDPQYLLLHGQTLQAQASLQSIQNSIDAVTTEIGAQGTGSANLFTVVDAPVVPTKPVSRTKDLLIAGGIGLGTALLGCILYIVIAIRRHRPIYSSADLQKVSSLQIVMYLPHLKPKAVSILENQFHQGK